MSTSQPVQSRLREQHCNASRRFLFFEYLSLSIFVYFGILSICITPNMPVAYMISGTVRPNTSVPPSRIPAPFVS